ncbi:flavodoxin domain-containing protein [Bifidobacterium pullorum]|uniref:flavodoxin domain-containing protein n=1 Tax=Bifidobacterium pullorum TaxID=78448 RepID=UPI0013781F3B|nr:flavodoxin domain-containing protein [Bifidobacterium pullorum]
MDTLIVYGGRYGTTERYADELARLLGTAAVPYVTVDDVSLVTADVIVYLGAVFAGGMPGLKRTMARLVRATERIRRSPRDDDPVAEASRRPRVIVVTVGLGDPAIPGNAEHLRAVVDGQLPPAVAAHVECFHLRGGIDYAALSPKHRAMMWMMWQHEKRVPEDEWTDDTRMFNETYGGAVDMVDFATLRPVLDAIAGSGDAGADGIMDVGTANDRIVDGGPADCGTANDRIAGNGMTDKGTTDGGTGDDGPSPAED